MRAPSAVKHLRAYRSRHSNEPPFQKRGLRRRPGESFWLGQLMCFLDVPTNLRLSFCEVVSHKATDGIPEVRCTLSFDHTLSKRLKQPAQQICKFRAIEVEFIFLNRHFGYRARGCGQITQSANLGHKWPNFERERGMLGRLGFVTEIRRPVRGPERL